MRSWAIVGVGLLSAGALWAPPADACMGIFSPLDTSRPPTQTRPTVKLRAGEMKVVVARDGDKTTLTLASEVRGPLRKFAMMIPVPGKLSRKQVRVLKNDALAELFAATAPVVDELNDPNPCPQPKSALEDVLSSRGVGIGSLGTANMGAGGRSGARASDYGVKVEQHIQVGGYDLAVLKATNAEGLGAWLRRFRYDVPGDVQALMGDYLEHGWRFVVARVNFKKLAKRPVDMLLFVLTKDGLSSVKGRLVKRLPTGVEVPGFAATSLDGLHRAVLERHLKAGKEAVVLEYSGPPRDKKQVSETVYGGYGDIGLRGRGGGIGASSTTRLSWRPVKTRKLASLGARWVNKKQPLWVTRYRVRFVGDPVEDLTLLPTAEQDRFEVRYLAHKPWQPPGAAIAGSGLGTIGGSRAAPKVPDDLCKAGREYLTALGPRIDKQVASVVDLTGWSVPDVKGRMGSLVTLEPPPPPPPPAEPPPPPAAEPPKPVKAPPRAMSVAETSSSGWRWGLGLFGFLALLVVVGRVQRGR
jgi:hypothetical protein